MKEKINTPQSGHAAIRSEFPDFAYSIPLTTPTSTPIANRVGIRETIVAVTPVTFAEMADEFIGPINAIPTSTATNASMSLLMLLSSAICITMHILHAY
jgi:hypothetical protein